MVIKLDYGTRYVKKTRKLYYKTRYVFNVSVVLALPFPPFVSLVFFSRRELSSLMYTACQNYMQIDIFAQTWIVFNKNSRNVARYMATLTHAQI